MSPTQRTLKHFRDLGYMVQVVEKYNAHSRKRHDLFGFGDVLAIGEGRTVMVQVTSGSNVAARMTKIKGECREQAMLWLQAGNEIEVHGWRKLAKYNKDGSRSKRDRVEVRVLPVRAGDLR